MFEDFVPLVVQIAGQDYTLRVPQSKVDLANELVQFVNQKMHDVSEKSGTVTTSRVAVLTALAIADELFSLREKMGLPLETARPAQKTTSPKPAKEHKELKEVKEVKEVKETKETKEVQQKVALLSSLIDEELSKS